MSLDSPFAADADYAWVQQSLADSISSLQTRLNVPAIVHEPGARLSPESVAHYFSAVFALGEQDQQRARNHLSKILPASLHAAAMPSVLQFDQSMTWIADLVFDEASRNLEVIPAPDRAFRDTASAMGEAMRIIEDEAPGVARDLASSVQGIAIASVAEGAVPFDGTTSLRSWGLIFAHAREGHSVQDALDLLVHESTHCALFARLRGVPVSTDSDRLPSPLRSDERPRDGVFHAVVVCGRLALLSQRRDKDQVVTKRLVDFFTEGRTNLNSSAHAIAPEAQRVLDEVDQHLRALRP